jgi:undecaprenyl-diphosphatase
VRELEKSMFENARNLVAAHEQAAIALGSLCVAAVVVGVGWGYRHYMSTWLATSARVGGLSLGVTVLAVEVSHGGWLTGVDHSVTAWLVAHRDPTMDRIALAVSTALGPTEIAMVAIVAAVIVGIKSRSALCGLTLLATVGGASLSCWLIKLLVARTRPPLAVQETLERDFSFPSGHVTGTAALVAMSAVAAAVLASRAAAVLLAVGGGIAVSAVGLSRLYLGVHWLTDVIAAVLLAAAVVTIGAATLNLLVDGSATTTAEQVMLDSSGKAQP